jgi:hypothetical protein
MPLTDVQQTHKHYAQQVSQPCLNALKHLCGGAVPLINTCSCYAVRLPETQTLYLRLSPGARTLTHDLCACLSALLTATGNQSNSYLEVCLEVLNGSKRFCHNGLQKLVCFVHSNQMHMKFCYVLASVVILCANLAVFFTHRLKFQALQCGRQAANAFTEADCVPASS